MSDLATAKTWNAARWVSLAQSAGVLADLLGQAKNDQARAIAVGKFLGGKVGRELTLVAGGRTGRAVLRATKGRSRQTGYYFEITWDQLGENASPPPGEATARPAKKKRKGKKKKVKPPTTRPTADGNDEEW